MRYVLAIPPNVFNKTNTNLKTINQYAKELVLIKYMAFNSELSEVNFFFWGYTSVYGALCRYNNCYIENNENECFKSSCIPQILLSFTLYACHCPILIQRLINIKNKLGGETAQQSKALFALIGNRDSISSKHLATSNIHNGGPRGPGPGKHMVHYKHSCKTLIHVK